jgi:uncharacterized protein YeaO (DUF488 family)
MIEQASVQQIRNNEINREAGHIAVVMRFYPRGLSKTLRDAYLPDLAPARGLFKDWQAQVLRVGHDQAFATVDYESRFQISRYGLEDLKRLVEISKSKKVYLVCQCHLGERCHREMLMLIAETEFGASVGHRFHDYPVLLARIDDLLKTAQEDPTGQWFARK